MFDEKELRYVVTSISNCGGRSEETYKHSAEALESLLRNWFFWYIDKKHKREEKGYNKITIERKLVDVEKKQENLEKK